LINEDSHPLTQKTVLFIFLLAKYAASLFLADLALMPIFQMPPE